MSEDTIWFIDKKKEECKSCQAIGSVRIEYYNAVRYPLEAKNEFVNYNLVKKKTKRICESCNASEESWEEWKETVYPKGFESDFFRRRALYFKDHIPAMAEEGFEDFFKRKPSDAEMRYEYGKFLHKKRELPRAYQQLKKALEKNKTYLAAIEELTEVLYTLFISQNEIWYEKRMFFGHFTRIFSSFKDLRKELINLLRYLLDYHKNNRFVLAKYYFQAGNALEDMHQYPLVLQYYEYVINEASENLLKSESCIRMAIVYSNLQDYKKAFSYLEKSYSLVPNVLIYLYKTKIYYKQGEKEKATHELNIYLKEIDKLIEKDPKNARIHYFKGLGLEYLESSQFMIEYYNGITKNLTIDIALRKVFYNKVNSLQDPPTETIEVVDSNNACPICKHRKINFIRYKDRVSGLEHWIDGINSTVYYLRSTKKICMHCNYEWWDYFNWDERESEYPG